MPARGVPVWSCAVALEAPGDRRIRRVLGGLFGLVTRWPGLPFWGPPTWGSVGGIGGGQEKKVYGYGAAVLIVGSAVTSWLAGTWLILLSTLLTSLYFLVLYLVVRG